MVLQLTCQHPFTRPDSSLPSCWFRLKTLTLLWLLMNASCHNCIGYLGIWLRLTEMKNQLCAWEWKQFFRWYSLFISPLATGKQRQEPLRDVRSLIEANMFNRTFFGALCRCQCCLPLRLKASWELENSLKTEWSPLTTSQPTKMDDGEDGILNICISLIFLNLTISTAKFLWNIAEKSWNLEGFVQLQLPDAQNAGGVLQATRLLVCQSQGSPKLDALFWLGDQRGWFGITMYYLYYSKFGECLPCALIKGSASSVTVSKCLQEKEPVALCACGMKGLMDRKGNLLLRPSLIEGCSDQSQHFGNTETDMTCIIYTWIFVYISVYTAILYAFNL